MVKVVVVVVIMATEVIDNVSKLVVVLDMVVWLAMSVRKKKKYCVRPPTYKTFDSVSTL